VSAETFSIARGTAGDMGTIVKPHSVTPAQFVTDLLRPAQETPTAHSFEDFSRQREAVRAKQAQVQSAKKSGDAASLAVARAELKPAKDRLDGMKRTPWYVCATFSTNERRTTTIERVTAFSGDADQPGTTGAALVSKADALGCTYILHTSTSHGCEGQPRFRVTIPLATPLEPHRYPELFAFMSEHFGGMLDPGAKDATRLNYLPRKPKGATGHEIICVDDRPWFEPSSIPAVANAPSAPSPGAVEQVRSGVTIEQLEEFITSNCDPSATEAQWWPVIRMLHFETNGSPEGLELACRWSRQGNNYSGDEPIRDKWNSPSWNDPNTPATTLTTFLKARTTEPDEFPVASEVAQPVVQSLVGAVPQALYACTDLANANRLRDACKGQLVALGGAFYTWTGKRWQRDESEATRKGAFLSNLVRAEAAGLREKLKTRIARLSPDVAGKYEELQACARPERTKLHKEITATDDGSEALSLTARIEALEDWAKVCEMEPTQARALKLLRKMLTVDADHFDRHKHLFNCLNGEVDLRTGELMPHDLTHFITQLAPCEYKPDASAPNFERFVVEIMSGEEDRAKFLQRWCGYGCTGETREQVFTIHTGGGSNGKTLLFETLQNMLGSSAHGGYVHTVASSLLVADRAGDRHPTEVADLHGKRFAMASETEDGAHLRESLLKLITGEDSVSARYMHRDFFTFKPALKINLRTNNKPVVRDQGNAIWRRILLVNYKETFGSQENIASKPGMKLRDNNLAEKLLAERQGILNWLVRGAVDWYTNGLRPPPSVFEAGRKYQSEQDRVAHFVRECCTLDPQAWSFLSGDFGLYDPYNAWCKSNGHRALGVRKFADELERAVPGFKLVEERRKVANGWKTATGGYGVSANVYGDMGGSSLIGEIPKTSKAANDDLR
jgi:P4 family phage/plasmid primase-like protien